MSPGRTTEVVLTFLEESQEQGIDYAVLRLQQRLQIYEPCIPLLITEAQRVNADIEQRYRYIRWGYMVAVVLGTVALILYLYVVCCDRFPDFVRLAFCVIVPAIIVFIRIYVGYLREAIRKQRHFCLEMAALHETLCREESGVIGQ